MIKYLKFLIPLYLLLSSSISFAQQNKIVDSMKIELSKATKLEDQVTLMGQISLILMNDNIEGAEKYGKELIQLTEKSRDRKQMVRAYLFNGLRCANFPGLKTIPPEP